MRRKNATFWPKFSKKCLKTLFLACFSKFCRQISTVKDIADLNEMALEQYRYKLANLKTDTSKPLETRLNLLERHLFRRKFGYSALDTSRPWKAQWKVPLDLTRETKEKILSTKLSTPTGLQTEMKTLDMLLTLKFYMYRIKFYRSSGESGTALAVANLERQLNGHCNCSKRIH